MERLPRCDEERYLVIDDTDEDVTELLTVICEGLPSDALSGQTRGAP